LQTKNFVKQNKQQTTKKTQEIVNTFIHVCVRLLRKVVAAASTSLMFDEGIFSVSLPNFSCNRALARPGTIAVPAKQGNIVSKQSE
jgi:hypothetical protein